MRSYVARVSGPWLWLLAAAGGCGRDGVTSNHVVIDSAGVRIVESARPAWRPGEGWSVATEPMLDVGVREGDDDYLLNRVMGVTRLDDGSIVVANMGDNTLRRFDASGRLVWRVGRSGNGPGEYRQLWAVRRLGDRILALQSRELWPDYVYDFDGNAIGSVAKTALQNSPALGIGMAGVFADGSYLFNNWPQGYPVKGDTWTDSTTLYVLSSDGSALDSVVRLPAVRFARFDQRRGDPIQFAPLITVTVGDSLIYSNFPEDYDIEVRDRSGRLVQRIRRAWTPEAVAQEAIDHYRHEFVNGTGEDGREPPQEERARRETLLAGRHYAEHYPAHGRMRVDRAGNLWVQQRMFRSGGSSGFNAVYPEPTGWDVFDARGVWLGSVETPPRFAIMEIGDDYMAGVWRDEVDVEHARVYALIRRD